MRFFNPRWPQRSRFPRVGKHLPLLWSYGRPWVENKLPLRASLGWHHKPLVCRACLAEPGGKGCQPERGEIKTEGLPWQCWLAHILRAAEQPQWLGTEVEFAAKLQFAGNGAKDWELLRRVTVAEGRELERF